MRVVAIGPLLFFLAACGGETPLQQAPVPATTAPSDHPERKNLLNAAYGAAVVSRTAELTLQNSAMRAIDGDPTTGWSAPQHDPKQTLTFSLAAPARIDKLGLETRPAPNERVTSLSFEVSSDGETFEKVLEVRPEKFGEPVLYDVSVSSARYIRVNVLEGGPPFATLRTVYVHGEWLEPRTVAPITGCWTINGNPARFFEENGRVTGVIAEDEPRLFSGGRHGEAYLLSWAKGPQWGEGFFTLTPDGNRLSALRWHEEPAEHSDGNGWFGERRPCTLKPADADRVWRRFLAAGGWYPLFEQDGAAVTIVENVLERLSSQRLRLVAREHREATPEANRKRAEARLESLRRALAERGVDTSRIDFDAVGSDSPRRPTPSEPLRMLYSVVEMQVAEEARSAF